MEFKDVLKNLINEKFSGNNSSFVKAFNSYNEKNGVEMSITSSAVSNYFNDSRKPSYEVVVAMAKFFSVSMDYMCGLTTDKTKNTTIKDISEVMGLSGDLLEAYINSPDRKQYESLFNYLLLGVYYLHHFKTNPSFRLPQVLVRYLAYYIRNMRMVLFLKQLDDSAAKYLDIESLSGDLTDQLNNTYFLEIEKLLSHQEKELELSAFQIAKDLSENFSWREYDPDFPSFIADLEKYVWKDELTNLDTYKNDNPFMYLVDEAGGLDFDIIKKYLSC